MSELISPLNCSGCGAPLKKDLVCRYCGTEHEYKERYRGPVIRGDNFYDFRPMRVGEFMSGSCLASTSMIVGSCTTILYG